jgi:hypothetical protein
MADEDLTRIFMGRGMVGIIGLKAAIEETRLFGEQPDEEIAQIL